MTNVLRFLKVGKKSRVAEVQYDHFTTHERFCGADVMPFDFSPISKSVWAFHDCFTIDPTKGAEAWEKLNRNQWGVEVGMLPKTLHDALLDTLRERKPFSRKLGK